MQILIFNLYLLISTGRKDKFAIIGMQTDNTLLLDTLKFLATKDQKIKEAEIYYKKKKTLILEKMLSFNKNKLTIASNYSIIL